MPGTVRMSAGAAGVALHLVAQPADVDIDRALALDVGVVAPHRGEDLLAAERLAGVARQKDEQLELGRGEVEQRLIAARLAAIQVDRQIASAQQIGVSSRRELAIGPAHMGANSGEQFTQPEGLGHVVVSAHLQPQHLVDLVALRGEDDDRLAQAGLAHLAAEVKAGTIGQPKVEEDQVRIGGARVRRSAAAGGVPRQRGSRSFSVHPPGSRRWQGHLRSGEYALRRGPGSSSS